MRKMLDEDKMLTLNEAVGMAAWTHNRNVMVSGYTPLQFMTGKSITFPSISEGNIAIETVFEDVGVRRILAGHFGVGKKFRNDFIWLYM